MSIPRGLIVGVHRKEFHGQTAGTQTAIRFLRENGGTGGETGPGGDGERGVRADEPT
jgi:hypothetical protein